MHFFFDLIPKPDGNHSEKPHQHNSNISKSTMVHPNVDSHRSILMTKISLPWP